MEFVWPLLVIGFGLAAPFLGSVAAVKGFKRYDQRHPEQVYPSGVDIATEEPLAWLLPAGLFIVAPTCLLAGVAWLIWVFVS